MAYIFGGVGRTPNGFFYFSPFVLVPRYLKVI